MFLSQFKENELYRFRQIVILTLLSIDHAQREDRDFPDPDAICGKCPLRMFLRRNA